MHVLPSQLKKINLTFRELSESMGESSAVLLRDAKDLDWNMILNTYLRDDNKACKSTIYVAVLDLVHPIC